MQQEKKNSKPAARPLLYAPLDFVLVRAPLLPVTEYLALAKAGARETAAAAPGSGQAASQRWRSGLGGLALRVASPALVAAIERLDQGRLNSRDAARLQSRLLRYHIRMSTRPTPFGLFAGVALATWTAQTNLAVQGVAARQLRPDMGWLLNFVAAQEAQSAVRQQLRLRAHPAALIRAGRVYLAARLPLTQAGDEETASIRATHVVRRALELAQQPIAYAELADQLLAASPSATPAKVEQLIAELLETTFLLTDLRPPLTGADPARYVSARLATIPAAQAAAAELGALLTAAAAWKISSATEEGTAEYQRMLNQAKNLAGLNSPGGEPFQVDAALSLSGNGINREVGHEAARAAELLLRLSPLPAGLPYLNAYRQEFVRRYGNEREVPLLEMLDAQVGLAMPTTGTMLPTPGGDGRRAETLLALAVSAVQEQRQVVELDQALLSRLQTWQPDPAMAPLSLDLNVLLAATSAAALDAGQFQLIVGPNLGAAAAGRNLGRFANLLGAAGLNALAAVAAAEQAHMPQALWAELTYLPRQLRSTNVTVRATRRDYEIAIGVSPGVDESHVVPLADLVVGVRNDRFVVRWPAAGCQVMISAGHMLNTLRASELVRFLSDVSRDGRAQLAMFDWGPATAFPFLPRVQAGRIVLRPAQWQLKAGELALDPAQFQHALDHWRDCWRVPRYIYVSESDHRLLLDLNDQQQVAELRQELHKLPNERRLTLQEVLPGFDQLWVPGPAGPHLTEFVVSLVLQPQPGTGQTVLSPPVATGAATAPTRASGVPAVAAQFRLRPPGSDWLYAKLYLPRTMEDDVIGGPLREFAETMRGTGLADAWFYIRYSDPEPHLRLRFAGDQHRITQQLLPAFCQWATQLMDDELCLRFSLETYEREVERFGGPAAIAAAEALFAADSYATSALLALEQQRLIPWDRITLAILTVDDLLTCLGLTLPERLIWGGSHGRHHGPDRAGDEYRQRKALLRQLLGHSEQLDSDPGGAAVSEVLAQRREHLAAVAVRLAELAALAKLDQPPAKLYHSFVHLHCNRLLGIGEHRETLVRDLLQRTWEGLQRNPVL